MCFNVAFDYIEWLYARISESRYEEIKSFTNQLLMLIYIYFIYISINNMYKN